MKTSIFAFMFFATLLTNAQDTFQRSYGGLGSDYGRAVIECSTGGYLVVGSSNSYFNSSSDVYVLRLDEIGDYIWGRNIGDEGHIDWAVDVVEGGDGNFYIAGYTDNSPSNTYDGLLIKIDASGNTIWTKTFGEDDWDFFYDMDIVADGNIICAGQKTENSVQKGWMILIDTFGEVIWERNITGANPISITGISICPNTEIVFVGTSQNLLLESSIQISGKIGLDNDNHSSSAFPELGNINSGRCKCSSQNNIISVGTKTNTTSGIFISSINPSSGIINWSHALEGFEVGEGHGIDINSIERVFIAGAIFNFDLDDYDAYSTVFTIDGNFLGEGFADVQGDLFRDVLFDIKATSDGGYVATGETNSYGGNFQIHVIKIDSLGNRDNSNEDFLDLATPTVQSPSPRPFAIYPNPANDFIKIELGGSTILKLHYSICDLSGKEIQYGGINGLEEFKIDTKNLKPGTYLLSLQSGTQDFPAQRFSVIR